MARGSHLEARLKAILDPGTSRRAVTRKWQVSLQRRHLLILAASRLAAIARSRGQALKGRHLRQAAAASCRGHWVGN